MFEMALIPKPEVEPWDPEPQQADDYDPNYRRERFGNNRKKTKGLVVKRKRKLAAASRKRNRK